MKNVGEKVLTALSHTKEDQKLINAGLQETSGFPTEKGKEVLMAMLWSEKKNKVIGVIDGLSEDAE